MESKSEFWYGRRDLEQETKGSAPTGRWRVLKAFFFVPLITSQLCPGKNCGCNRSRVGGEERAKESRSLEVRWLPNGSQKFSCPFCSRAGSGTKSQSESHWKKKKKSPVSAPKLFSLLEPLHWKESWLKEKQSHFEFYSMKAKDRSTSGHVMVLYILYCLKRVFLIEYISHLLNRGDQLSYNHNSDHVQNTLISHCN